MTSLARRVGVVEEKMDRLDRLEAAVDRYVQEGAREREEARRRHEKFEQFMQESARERRETNRKWGEAGASCASCTSSEGVTVVARCVCGTAGGSGEPPAAFIGQKRMCNRAYTAWS